MKFLVIFYFICLISSKINCNQISKFASINDADNTLLYQSHCLNNDHTEIKIECSNLERIKILKTVYGYNPHFSVRLFKSSIKTENLCSFSVNDCIYVNDTSLENECNGRNSCSSKINKTSLVNRTASNSFCKDFNYVQINYYCLPELPTIDICESNTLQLKNAYLISPNFPSLVETDSPCECELSSTGQILLKLVDMKLNREDYTCDDAYFESRENEISYSRFCGYIKDSHSIFGSGSNKLKLSFAAKLSEENQLLKNRGFWLEILSSPTHQKIEINCNLKRKPKVNQHLNLDQKLKEIKDIVNKTFSEANLKDLLLNQNTSLVEDMRKVFGELLNKKMGITWSPKQTTTEDELDIAIRKFQKEYLNSKKISQETSIDSTILTTLKSNLITEKTTTLYDDSEKQWAIAMESVRDYYQAKESKSLQLNFKSPAITSSNNTSSIFQLPKRLIRNPLEANQTGDNTDCEVSVSRFPVYYNNFEKFDCNETILNESLLKCTDSLLEWKLNKRLNFYYDVRLQPVFIFKHKMNCLQDYTQTFPKRFTCSLITKSLINKKKVIWKLMFKIKNYTCASFIKVNATKTTQMTNTTTKSGYYQNTSTTSKKNHVQNSTQINEFSFESLFSNKLVIITFGSFSIAFVLIANLILYFIFAVYRKSNPNSNSLTMSMNNRLLQNYLDLSLPSKKSLKLEGYKIEDDTLVKKKEFNPKFEINTLLSDKLKLNFGMCSVATQVNMIQNSLITECKDFIYQNQELVDVESQILSIEVLDNEQTNSNFAYVTTTDASKKISGKASIRINDLKAFKNSSRLNKGLNETKEDDSILIDSEITSITTPLENKLVFRFSKSITDDHLKLEQDMHQLAIPTQRSLSILMPSETALESFLDTKDFSFNSTQDQSILETKAPSEMMYRAAVISNSNQSIVSNYLNSQIFDKSVYELLNSIPYLKATFRVKNSTQKNETINLEEMNKQKLSLKSVSSYELKHVEQVKKNKLSRSMINLAHLKHFNNRLTKSLTFN